MIDSQAFLQYLTSEGVKSFFGVPDSLLKSLNSEIAASEDVRDHVVCANEGAAVGCAVGHFLGSGDMAVVYLQNSGLGNTVNPLLSIADPSVYSVPMLIIIGWRGEPGVTDEPQHMRQGELTAQLLNDLGVVTRSVTREDHADWREKVGFLIGSSRRERRAVALVVGKDTFQPSQKSKNLSSGPNQLLRESALEIVISKIPPKDLTVATTGMLGRELYELRNPHKEDVHDFLNVGGMGHASSIALGLSLAQPGKRIWCLDGDGSAIMHLGSLAVIAGEKPKNLKHIVFNNRAHDSVGGQPTAAESFSFAPVATALGYELGLTAATDDEVADGVEKLLDCSGPALLEINIRRGSRKDLGRPQESPRELIDKMMTTLGVSRSN